MTGLTDIERDAMQWGFKLAAVDLTTDDHDGGRYQYRPGEWHTADPGGREFTRDMSACPRFPGDGLCVAHTLAGASSGGHRVGASTMLVVGWDPADVLAATPDKSLVSRLWIEPEVVDPVRLIEWAAATGVTFQGAILPGAILPGAILRGAILRGADLQGAILRRAILRGADLQGADLQGAYLQGADLRGADLRGADLRYADLQDADLRYADLQDANLQGAYLRGAHVDDTTVLSNGWRVVNGRAERVEW